MDYLRFIFYLSVIYITFDFIWQIFLFMIRIMLGIDRHERTPHYIFKALGYFLLVSLTAVTTNNEIFDRQRDGASLAFILIALLGLYFYITSNMEKSRLRAAISMDILAVKRMRYNSIFLILSLAFFVACIAWPQLAANDLSEFIFHAIERIYDLFIFRIILGFLAVIFIVNMLLKGIGATRMLINNLLGILGIQTVKARHRYESFSDPGEDIIDVDYKEES